MRDFHRFNTRLLPVNARLLIAIDIAFYAVTMIIFRFSAMCKSLHSFFRRCALLETKVYKKKAAQNDMQDWCQRFVFLKTKELQKKITLESNMKTIFLHLMFNAST